MGYARKVKGDSVTKRLEWTERHWAVAQKLLWENEEKKELQAVPYDAMLYRLREQSPNITVNIAMTILAEKHRQGVIEYIRRGNTRRRNGALYVRLIDHRPKQVDQDDLAQLLRGARRRKS
jgi:hypothetical protein